MSDFPRAESLPRTLVVTNDFPPRVGGVQQYVFNLASHFPADRVCVLAPAWDGDAAHDEALAFRVERSDASMLRPTPGLRMRVHELVRETRSEVVLFGSALPPALLGPALAASGTPYVVATHGVEYWMSLVPGASNALRYATSRASRVLVIAEFTGRTIRTVVPDRVPMSIAPPGVDVERFRPNPQGGDEVRARHRLSDRPLIVCISRLVRRKGQDALIRALPRIRRRVPDATLLIVGEGPDRAYLDGLASDAVARDAALRNAIVFAGAVPDEELPAYHAAADVFAMPCRSRLGGLEVEGFGIVFMEAAASGKPVVAGASGGSAEAVLDGETGLVIDGRHDDAVAEAVSGLLLDTTRADRMGKAGRARAERLFAWPVLAARTAEFLREAVEVGGKGVGR